MGLAHDAAGGGGEGGLQEGEGLVAAWVVALAAAGFVEAVEEAGGGALDGGGEFEELVAAGLADGGGFDARGNKGVGDGVLLVLRLPTAVGLGGAGSATVDGAPAGAAGAQFGVAHRAARNVNSSRVDSGGDFNSPRVVSRLHDRDRSRTAGPAPPYAVRSSPCAPCGAAGCAGRSPSVVMAAAPRLRPSRSLV
ncbi:hypothetical protein [Kitasatospora sp. NBC_00039]|uniref:hypothetical protein n=1 Tax=Kitasatospora sp. NBC_00039 TaxID=2903565 RepID=UPI00324CFF89